MTPLEILRGARELLAKPERWTKGESARDAWGKPISAFSTQATCFCLIGALYRAGGSLTEIVSIRKALQLLKTIGSLRSLAAFSDEQATHADILALLDRGIEQLEDKS